MKIATTALAFLIAAGSPLWASGLGTNMDCEIDIFWDTDSNTEPTQAELDWAGEKLRYYFNFVSQETADGDFDMSSEESTGVDISKNHAEATFDGIASCNACDCK